MTSILPPTNCPSCGSLLEWKKDLLYCLNLECPAKTQKVLEYWAKSLKIKGLGPSSLAKLEVETIPDIYNLTLEEAKEKLGSEKLASKVIEEIRKSETASLNRVLPAFGIPLIGNSATAKLCSVLNHMDEYTPEVGKRAGLGPKANSSLEKWYNENYPFYKAVLPFSFKSENSETKALTRGVVCISGKLKSFKTKEQASEALISAGFQVKSSITKDVNILVNESGVESAKTKKARESGITIVENLLKFIGEI